MPTAEQEQPGDDPQAGASAHTEYLEANGEAEPDQPAEGGVEESAASPAAEVVTDFGTDEFVAEDVPNEETPAIGDDVAADETYGLVDDDETAINLEPAIGSETDPEADLVYVTESDASTDVESGANSDEETRARWSGEGVYVGAEPPEGYTIKGNERSMKYHLPESGGYGRTIAEVWFNSEEAAQAAGFIRAQR